MSEPGPEPGAAPREWRFYIEDMIGFAERVLRYTQGMDQAAFLADARTYDATLRNIELIGEAAIHIPDEIRSAHPEIAWRRIVGTRNRLAHAYLYIDDDVLWDIVRTDIPRLLPQLRRLSGAAGGQGE